VLFNTVDYAIFFAIVFMTSWAMARWLRGWPRLVLLLLASYWFYAHWDWRYLPLIFGSSTVDFYLARWIASRSEPRSRKRLLVITVVLNLGLLAVFKYWNFGVENVRLAWSALSGQALAAPTEAMKVLLPPVGISFFTFVSMSYVIDVYRKRIEPHRSYLRYILFVAFFPHLVAGPIVRARDLLPQFERPPRLTREEGGEGLFLVAVGLIKKVVIADQLALQLVDRVFDNPQAYSAVETVTAVYGYAVQIYCDFSGYSDIAIGSALLLGIRFPINFDSPYKAHNLADFWHRWHISLSTWLRDYLYIPLGGSRGSPLATYRNLMITMLLGGLWHGASWAFVFWGFLHGLGLAVTRAVQRRREQRAGGRTSAPSLAHKLTAGFLTFQYVCLAWIFFRAPTFEDAMEVIRRIASFSTETPNLPPVVLALLGIGMLSHFTPRDSYRWCREQFTALPAPAQGVVLFLVAVLLHEAASTQAVPFVYFQF
jgi:D-alanyl-lipoteichoic acid acyltransferase DltB (MBOAT superfamily)